jgi:osmotically-inducible protein OsmY
MRRSGALAALLLLNACGSGGSDDTRAPAAAPTLAPTEVIKDALLYAAVKARLAGSDIDSTARISVRVRGGVATVSGVVKDAATKAREVELVHAMRGIRGVNDQLQVGRAGPGPAQAVGNAALLAAVEGRLTAQAGVNVARVKVNVDAGRVTLSGSAPTPALKTTLLAAARQTPGVRNVVDNIVVK